MTVMNYNAKKEEIHQRDSPFGISKYIFHTKNSDLEHKLPCKGNFGIHSEW
jgi:hypothetical protein